MKQLEITKNIFARPMVLFAVGVAAGILAGDSGGTALLVFLMILFIFGFWGYKCAETVVVKNRRLLILFIIILSFLTGMIRCRDTKDLGQNLNFPDRSVKDTYIEAQISDIALGKDQYIFILDNPICDKIEYDMSDLKVMVYFDALNGAKEGDTVAVKGTLYAFSSATNYGQFDQREYYLAKNIGFKLYADELWVLKKTNTFKGMVNSFLFGMSQDFQMGLNKVFDEKDMGILSAMLAGNRTELDDSTKGLYQKMGIAHVLSISGLHITLIGVGLFSLLLKLTGKLYFSVVSTCVIIVLYGIFTGFSVSTVRAVIMLSCMLLGKLIGESYDGQSAAGLAAIIILVLKPLSLKDSGFQLSFIAVLGIFAGNEIRRNLKIKNKIALYIMPAFCAQIATFPIILRSYYSFSPYSIIANIVLLPFMPVIVVSGFVAGMLGALSLSAGFEPALSLAELAAGPAHFMLKGYESVSVFLLELPGADVITGCPVLWKCVMFYALLFMIVIGSRVYKLNARSSEKNFKSGGSGRFFKNKKGYSLLNLKGNYHFHVIVYIFTILLMLNLLLLKRTEKGFYTGFIDVGQGLSVYIEADGKKMLADGGSSNVKNVGKYRIEPFLLWKGVSELDYVFVSHTDEDHISGIREIIEEGRIRIKNLVVGYNNPDDEKLLILAKNKGINIIKTEAGKIIDNNDDLFLPKEDDNSIRLSISVLSPDKGFIYEDKNQASLVLDICYGKFSMLFTGDSDIYSESEYVRYLESLGRVNILQCPHHGSKYSCSELLLKKADPDITVISCSKTNMYGHPSPETIGRIKDSGSDCYITSKDGMVVISFDGKESYSVECYVEN